MIEKLMSTKSYSTDLRIRVINYIKNQEEHHSKKSFGEEVALFLEKYDFRLGDLKNVG